MKVGRTLAVPLMIGALVGGGFVFAVQRHIDDQNALRVVIARDDCMVMAAALAAYYVDYRKWPSGKSDFAFDESILNVLTNPSGEPGVKRHYIDIAESWRNGVRDPWGNRYQCRVFTAEGIRAAGKEMRFEVQGPAGAVAQVWLVENQ